jgi:hypothetical protein
MIVSCWSYHDGWPVSSSFTPRRTVRFSAQRSRSCLYLTPRSSDAQGTLQPATSMLRDAQPDAHGIRRCPLREKGKRRSRRTVGGVGTTLDAILRARDGSPGMSRFAANGGKSRRSAQFQRTLLARRSLLRHVWVSILGDRRFRMQTIRICRGNGVCK